MGYHCGVDTFKHRCPRALDAVGSLTSINPFVHGNTSGHPNSPFLLNSSRPREEVLFNASTNPLALHKSKPRKNFSF